jgi:hypothetical protein
MAATTCSGECGVTDVTVAAHPWGDAASGRAAATSAMAEAITSLNELRFKVVPLLFDDGLLVVADEHFAGVRELTNFDKRGGGSRCLHGLPPGVDVREGRFPDIHA